jgi:predicted nucleic acid-binding protein
VIVADTNVVAYLVLPSPHTALAERLFLADPEWVAPLLWRSEMRNVLALYLRKSLVTLEQAVALQQEAEEILRGREYEIGSDEVLDLVARSSCSAYDCEFVALARNLGVPLATMDRKLVAAFPDTAVLLGDAVAS